LRGKWAPDPKKGFLGPPKLRPGWGFYINPSRRGPAPGAGSPPGPPGQGSPQRGRGSIPPPSGGVPPQAVAEARTYTVKKVIYYTGSHE